MDTQIKEILKKSKYHLFVSQHSVSKSGMTRKLSIYANTKQNVMTNLTGDVAKILGWTLDKNGFLVVSGCGMDMHFHTIYTLSCALYGYSSNKNKGGYKLQYATLW